MSQKKWKKSILTDKELEEAIAHLSDSEDEFDIDEDDEENDNNVQLIAETGFTDVELGEMPIEFLDDGLLYNVDTEENTEENSEEDTDKNSETLQAEQEPIRNPKQEAKDLKTKYANILWRKKNLVLDESAKAFGGNTEFPPIFKTLVTPFEFFKYFFDNELLTKIVEESNLYSTQIDPNKSANITTADIKQYMGICIYMSIVHMPNVRSYWSSSLGFDKIRETMSYKKFETIRRYLHFNDNTTALPKENIRHDRLHKLRPIINMLNFKYQTVPLQPHLSVDEQLCATKARHYIKQYLPAKPHKWGYKLYILSGTDGFCYNFEIYTGAENDPKFRLPDEPDLGSSANIVLRLCRIVPTNHNFQIYFDNFYTSIPLVVYLAKRGIFSLGTVRRPRIPNCKLPSENEMKIQSRGSSHEFVSNIEGVDVSSVIWKDNKLVLLLSTFTGQIPFTEVRRFDKKEKKSVNIQCPSLIKEYNKHMGGVDLMDGLIGRYKIKMRTKKWYLRLFYHLLDMTIINSWLVYRKMSIARNTKYLPLAEFRSEVAYCLCFQGHSLHTNKRGRPSDVERQIQEKKKRSATTAYVPPKDVRQDSVNHWPFYDTVRQRCKLPQCKSFSFIKCIKCGLHLCLNKNNNCFTKFHTA